MKTLFALRNLILMLVTVSLLHAQDNNIYRSDAEAHAIADTVYSKLVSGADFKKLVIKYSEDPGTKSKGGIYPHATTGIFVSEFENVVLALKLNEISPPFKTQYGYHIAQVVSRSGEYFDVRHILIRCKE